MPAHISRQYGTASRTPGLRALKPVVWFFGTEELTGERYTAAEE
jgi:hypothetical protein